jgi:hypothetical protein
MKSKIVLIALAVVCILVAPALSMPQDKGMAKQGGCRLAANNLTEAQMNNMTLGELEKLRQPECANPGMNGSSEFGSNQSRNGPRDHAEMHQGDDAAMGFGGQRSGESPLFLLMDDVTADQLGNMTLNEIKALKQKKMTELDNMTIGQIKALEQKKLQELNNMTVGEFSRMENEQREISRIIGFVQVDGSDGLHRQGSTNVDAGRGRGQGSCPMARNH